jgi:hypothetical protein
MSVIGNLCLLKIIFIPKLLLILVHVVVVVTEYLGDFENEFVSHSKGSSHARIILRIRGCKLTFRQIVVHKIPNLVLKTSMEKYFH